MLELEPIEKFRNCFNKGDDMPQAWLLERQLSTGQIVVMYAMPVSFGQKHEFRKLLVVRPSLYAEVKKTLDDAVVAGTAELESTGEIKTIGFPGTQQKVQRRHVVVDASSGASITYDFALPPYTYSPADSIRLLITDAAEVNVFNEAWEGSVKTIVVEENL